MSIVMAGRSVAFFSSARSRSRSACSWRSVAAFFSQAALSSMGNTPLYWPGLRIERITTVAAEMCTWSASVEVAERSSPPPPIVQCAPMRALPAMPTQPAIAVCAPMRTLWPIWIRLSSLTPSLDHGVVERAAVDAGVGADLDVVADAHARRAARSSPSGLRSARSRSRRRR